MPDPTPSLASFQTTHWSLVNRAAGEDSELQRHALSELITRYTPALRAHLVLHKRVQRHEADDIIQSFLASKILEQRILERAEPERGRFRSFLLCSLDHFLISRVRHEKAARRSPVAGTASLDVDPDLAASGGQPDAAYDIEWARALLSDAVDRMKAQCLTSGRQTMWNIFEERVLKPASDGTEPMDYLQLVKQFGFKSPREVQNVLVNAKRRFTGCLRAAIAVYEPGEAEIEAEILDLHRILSGERRP